MFSGWLLSLLAVGYIACLFGIAFYGDRHRLYPNHRRLRPYIYGLALGVYCTSWTFFGAVGSAGGDDVRGSAGRHRATSASGTGTPGSPPSTPTC